MRRLIVMASLLALVAMACKIETNFGVTINADGSGLIVAEVGMDEEAQGFFLQDGTDPFEGNDLSGAENAVQRTETRGDMTFWIIEAPVDDISTVEDEVIGAENSLLSNFDVTVTDDRVSVSATATAEDAMGDSGTEGFDPSVLEESVSFNVVITMPGRILSHNADSVQGNTLSWKVPVFGGTLDIQAESDPTQSPAGGDGSGIPIWVWIAIGVVLVAGAGYWWMQQQKSQTGSSGMEAADTPTPAPPADE